MEEKSSRSAEEDKLMEDSKIFSDEEQFLNATDMESDDMMDGKGKGNDISVSMSLDMTTDLVKGSDVNEETLSAFCREASQAFFDEFGLISHQLNSYNELVTNGIQRLFDSFGEITVQPGYGLSKKGSESSDGWRRATITYGKVTLEPPTFWTANGDECLKLMPKHARLQKMTYSSQMKVEINVQIYKPGFVKSDKYKTGKEKYADKSVLGEVKTEIVMGRIPVMVGSKLCWLHKLDKSDCLYDSGGYFLIKGMEKAFVAQETRCLNRIWVSDKPAWMVTYYSEPAAKRKRIYVKLAEATKKEGFSGEKIINVSFLYAPVPIWVMFFALGASSDKEVFQMIDLDSCDAGLANILLATINDADENYEGFRNRGKALEHVNGLIKNVKYPPSESIEECISHYLFPSIDEHKQKALFLGYMVKCLLLACSGRRVCDNRDDFRNKRLDLAGELLAQELWINIRHAERRMVRAMQRDLDSDRDLQLIERYLDASIITNGLMRAFSTGLWSHPYIRTQRCPGVVATLRRTNPLQMMSDLRKTRQQVLYGRKRGDERYPNPSYWGKVCFLSTPDGENCGLVKNLAVTGLVSTKLMEPLLDKLISCGMEELDADNMWSLSGMDKVFLNGDWVGVCQNPSSFVMKLRSMRRTRLINLQVEIKWDKKQREIRIFSDAGRILRPLLIVENLEKIKKFKRVGYSFESLLNEQIIELIGTEEEEDCQTAWGIKYLFKTDWQASPKYTHCELDISFLLGLSCGIIPFANHNFARRVLYQSEKQSQQAIGFSTTNPNIRVDTLSHQLYYPQKPLFRTMISDCIGKRDYKEGKDYMAKPEIFNGQNAIVAVNVHQGYNQEDSLVINRASLERGMFRTEHFRSYKAEVDNREVVSTKYLKLKEKVDFGKGQSTFGRADSLDDDGFPYVGASLQSGDVVIGKLTESKDSKFDQCLKLKHTERGMVQKVVLSSNDEGKNFGVVTLRQVRSPCLGDKFSSMHGQKGVVGFLESQENFPFTLQGIVPDIVINPHSFPTRQTPGQLLESALGKGIACGGSMRYATPFSTASVEVITEQLHRAGYSKGGDEKVCSGRTGEMIPCMIFMGPTFYQRLIHMAEDKVKFRNTGPVHPLTRQPVADRKRFGGVKFGEMERDCLLAHGAAANLHERLFLLSDFSQMHICQTCSRFANVIQRPAIDSSGKKFRGPYCQSCQSSENLVKVNVPYGAKLLYQELFSMGICLKFETEIC